MFCGVPSAATIPLSRSGWCLEGCDQFFELVQPAVPQEVARLCHGNSDDAPLRVVEPGRAVATRPAVTARHWPLGAGLRDDAYPKTPAAAAENGAGAGDLVWRQVVRRHQVDRLLRQKPVSIRGNAPVQQHAGERQEI